MRSSADEQDQKLVQDALGRLCEEASLSGRIAYDIWSPEQGWRHESPLSRCEWSPALRARRLGRRLINSDTRFLRRRV